MSISTQYPIDFEYVESILNNRTLIWQHFGKYISQKEVIDKLENPKSYWDLVFIAECCHYKNGWAFYEAKNLGFSTPKPLVRQSHAKRNKKYCPDWDNFWE